MEDSKSSLATCINVKLFNAATSKYINTQKLIFFSKDTTSSSKGSKKSPQVQKTTFIS